MERVKKFLNTKTYKELCNFGSEFKKQIILVSFINIINVLLPISVALMTKNLIDKAVDESFSESIKYGIILGILILLQLIMNSISSLKVTKIKEKMKNKLQLDVLKAYYKKNYLFLNEYRTGDIQTRVFSDVGAVTEIWLASVPSIIALFIQLSLAFYILFKYDPYLAVLIFLITPITLLVGWIIGRKTMQIQHLIQKAESVLRSYINESIQNIVVLKIFEFININVVNTKEFQTIKYNQIIKKQKISVYSNLFFSLGYRVGFFGAIVFGAYRLSEHSISFGQFILFIQLVGQIQGPIEGLSKTVPQIVTALASVERLVEIQNIPEDKYIIKKNSIEGSINSIIFENVSFGYTKDKQIIENINLQIKSGEKIAIIGNSGKGKTTLISLLLSLFEPNIGRVGLNTSNELFLEVSAYTRRYFSYVPQNNSLFSGTISDNLYIAKPDATKEEIIYALKAANAIEFVEDLPNGINTIIGERGIGISEGQAQRIAIARAFVNDAPIIIFDEATSALDMETENNIIKSMDKYYPNKTLIAITHRDSIFKICDRIIKLENKGIIEVTRT